MRWAAAAASIGPATYPPAPNTTSGRTLRRILMHAAGATAASPRPRRSPIDGRRGSPVT